MNHRVITIGRLVGSGGHEIGQALAQELGIAFYDRELIEIASKRSGVPLQDLEKHDERSANPLLYPYPEVYTYIAGYGDSTNDILFNYQAEIMKEAAHREDCVIVGRCADFVLRENPLCRNVFIHGEWESRVNRLMKLHRMDRAQAETLVKKTDKRRRIYYNFYTDQKWGAPGNYHLTFSTDAFPKEAAVGMLKQLFATIRE